MPGKVRVSAAAAGLLALCLLASAMPSMAAKIFSVPPRGLTFTIISNTSRGKCIHPSGGTGTSNNTPLVLHDGCTTHKFVWEANGAIRYAPTGKCFHPYGGTANSANQAVVLHDGCDAAARPQLAFDIKNGTSTGPGMIRHVQSGMCLRLRDATLDNATPLLFWAPCYYNSLTSFIFNVDGFPDCGPWSWCR